MGKTDKSKSKKKTCFVIGPIGKPDSDIRKWSNTIIDYVIKPAVEACGYKDPVRADHISQSGMISIDVIERIMKDDLVVADLTGSNANVFYELAIRHAARKPFVQLIKTGEKIPFDTKDLRTIEVDTDIAVATRAMEKLKEAIPEVEVLGDKVVTPISLTADLELMKSTGRTEQKMLAHLIEKVELIGSHIEGEHRQVNPPIRTRADLFDDLRQETFIELIALMRRLTGEGIPNVSIGDNHILCVKTAEPISGVGRKKIRALAIKGGFMGVTFRTKPE